MRSKRKDVIQKKSEDWEKCRIIEVTYDAEAEALNIKPGDRHVVIEASSDRADPCPEVIWNFNCIEDLEKEGYFPIIRFEDSFRGPFTSLCQMNGAVTYGGNDGIENDYCYSAVLMKRDGISSREICSEPATLRNNITTPDTSPFISVKILREKNEKGDRLLHVWPQAIVRTHGQPVVWRLIDVPKEFEDCFPRVVFEPLNSNSRSEGKNSEVMNSHYGPFLSWQVDKQTVIGLGHSEDSGRWKYRFEMMSRTGETRKLLSSPDPTVDDEGDPTGNQP